MYTLTATINNVSTGSVLTSRTVRFGNRESLNRWVCAHPVGELFREWLTTHEGDAYKVAAHYTVHNTQGQVLRFLAWTGYDQDVSDLQAAKCRELRNYFLGAYE